MRRVIGIAMVISGIWALISGISQFIPPFDTIFDPGHVVSACSFAVLVGIHICLNAKPLVRYFKGLGRWWILIGFVVAGTIVFEGIIVTVLIATGVWSGG
jgi:hypothetical protein